MGYGSKAIPYPAAHDYGPRDRWPTLAVTWHMADGKNVAQYLSRDPARGVSVRRLLRRQPCKGGLRQVLAGHEPERPGHQRRGRGSGE